MPSHRRAVRRRPLCAGAVERRERAALASRYAADAPPHIAGDYPEWLDGYLAQVFGDDRVAEATAMASRAPLDLRVNTLKAKREKVLGSTAHLGTHADAVVADRLAHRAWRRRAQSRHSCRGGFHQGRHRGAGRRLAAGGVAVGAKPGEQVIDLCAGAGGKTLALAAMMQGKGRLIATDHDKRQLAPIYERLSRAGVHNCDVRTPKGPNDTLADIHASADLVLIDAPCTGTGTWRRNPDAKWRMRPGALEVRLKDQIAVLDRAAALVKPGGRIAYITCSVLPPENGEQVRAFLARHPEFAVVPPAQTVTVLWDKAERFRRRPLQSAGGPADDAAPHRNRRVFRVGAAKAGCRKLTLVMPRKPLTTKQSSSPRRHGKPGWLRPCTPSQ